ncbi:MAG: AIR synthase-related protein, partial [Candidatus Bathyarchaeota archaeon]|nr:AIR synthase-related protein [Candidatus Bathyarchaeota archaeon]
MGKLPNEKLKELLKHVKQSPKVVIPPTLGFDSGVHRISKEQYLVISTDPCLNVPEKWFGWLLINYAASDVALFGAKPEFCAITLMGPLTTQPAAFIRVMEQVGRAAEELDMTVITGHTGAYDGLLNLAGVCTAYGTVHQDKLITPRGAHVGDHIICSKAIGLETAVNFALTHRALADELFTMTRAHALRSQVREQTCVREALTLAKGPGVHAMHDTTEGGLVTALNEMAESAALGFQVDLEEIPFVSEAPTMKEYFGLSQRELLSISSTGTLLAAVAPEVKNICIQRLRENAIDATS